MNACMSKWGLVAGLALATSGVVNAAGTRNDSKTMDMSRCQEMMGGDHGAMMGKDHKGMMGKGTVQGVDAAGGKVTLDHEAIESIGWPKMTMSFRVQDPKQLEGLKPVQAVNFSLAKQGSDYVITAIK